MAKRSPRPVMLWVIVHSSAVFADRVALRGCEGGRFSVHTQSSKRLAGGWVDPSPGWRQRSVSPEITAGEKYHVRAEVTRTSWRVVMRRSADGPWDMPFWDTGKVPMDEVVQTRLVFADVEPEGSHGGTRWGPVRISR